MKAAPSCFHKKHLALLVLLLCSMGLFHHCLVMDNQFPHLAPGLWRATLQLLPKESVSNPKGKPLPELMEYQFEEVSGGELPFFMDVQYEPDSNIVIHIINGEERIPVRDVRVFKDKASPHDSVYINFPVYDSFIRAAFEERVISGEWVVNNRGSYYAIPFAAKFGQGHRFTTLKKTPMLDLSGKWAAQFGIDSDDPWPAIGIFRQDGNQLSGTFTTETGDYRFLEGTIQDNKMYLSCFDGSHAFLFEAKINPDSTLIGSFRSGKHYRTMWKAHRDPTAQLTSPDSLTFLNEGYDKFSFLFTNPEGKVINTEDDHFRGKVKIYQILGTWCPNCRDETTFLVDYLKNNPSDDLEVVALAFEKYRDKDKANAAIKRYQKAFGMPYEIVHAGYYNKKEAAQALPMLNHVLSYPTLIFVDKNDQVRRIHTGFYGPATSEYASFQNDFDVLIKQLINEESIIDN